MTPFSCTPTRSPTVFVSVTTTEVKGCPSGLCMYPGRVSFTGDRDPSVFRGRPV